MPEPRKEKVTLGSVIHILHLEDDPVDSQLAIDLLRSDGLEVELERAQTLAQFQRGLSRESLNLILSDYTIPGTNVLDALRLAHERRPDVPYIFVSGTIGEDLAIECLKRGATDYVLKTHLSRLAPSVRRALQEAEAEARRKQGDHELAKTTARFDGIISSAMDAIISINARQEVVLFNPAAEKMFGVSAAQALGRNINRFIPPRFWASHTREVKEFGATGVSTRSMSHLGFVTGLRASGEEFPIEASISRVEIQGEPLCTVILRDITDRMDAEAALKQARDDLAVANTQLERKVEERTAQLREANTNLQTFAYTAAHDLRAPLRAIRSFSAILLEDYGAHLGDDARSLLRRVTEASDQMKQLLDDLLEYSKVSAQEIKLEPVSLKTAVAEALKLLEEDIRTRRATIAVTDPLPSVIGHQATVVLLIQNLLANALKFVAPDLPPRIRIWAEPVRGTASHVQSQRPAPAEPAAPEGQSPPSFGADRYETALTDPRPPTPRVRLWIEDNGIGIPAEDVGKIFAVFQRLHSKQAFAGTGLGLAICRKGAERMGGRVGVESDPGKGSRFWVELPLAAIH
ncbi:MAG TPA: ATP-binding protein [Verrucomicrobiae bacterium]